ncbi:TM2 domain-containing protein [Staphylococcus auricularis]|uniref:TM2 domain-containing protein n=1 Tax=Staphylococcus auricularis TaxID=29379 RepID=A0AAW7MF93_9STAP|nr:TM2 domain-containing protein [Staphylococcus auricularis]MDC6327898.1 TM2 domain-containing protein [Staphylococcus auricularis]MDN4533909.1 TM2 domain-containing protein [Staphylococcus auricularis]HJE01049.1 TM2 domain-containing protein [Staphylococcus auricularis]
MREVNKVIYIVLAFLLGGFGIHNFYAGKIGLGILFLLFFWLAGITHIITIIQGILAIFKKSDKNGNIQV